MISVQNVIDFFNHKAGELAYFIEEEDKYRIFTRDSKWLIFKDFNKISSRYILYHSSSSNNHKHYHNQMDSDFLDYLVFRACVHDYRGELPNEISTWPAFKHAWEMYCLGRDIAESVGKWIYLHES